MNTLAMFERLHGDKAYWTSRIWIEFIDAIYNDVSQDSRLITFKNLIIRNEYSVDNTVKYDLISLIEQLSSNVIVKRQLEKKDVVGNRRFKQ